MLLAGGSPFPVLWTCGGCCIHGQVFVQSPESTETRSAPRAPAACGHLPEGQQRQAQEACFRSTFRSSSLRSTSTAHVLSKPTDGVGMTPPQESRTAHSAAPTPADQAGLLLDGDELENHLRAVLDQQGGPPADNRSLPRKIPTVPSGGGVTGKPPLPGHGRSPIGSSDDLYKMCDPRVNADIPLPLPKLQGSALAGEQVPVAEVSACARQFRGFHASNTASCGPCHCACLSAA